MKSVASTSLSFEYADDGKFLHKFIDNGSAMVESIRERASNDTDLAAAWAKAYLLGKPIRSASSGTGKVRSVELFCGSGGMALGFGEAVREIGLRFESEACLDQDAEAVDVYAANHRSRLRSAKSASEIVDYQIRGEGSSAEFLYDPELTDSAWARLQGEVDVLLAGPPCQGHSNLNNKTRRTDKRNQLYLTVPATAVALGVDTVIIENVEAVIHDRSRVVDTARALLEKAGYSIQAGVISATSVGWPQTRRRYFMIGRRSVQPLPISAVIESLSAQSPRNVMWAIDDLMTTPFDGRLHISVELSEENRRRIDFLFDNDVYDLPLSERPECHRDGTSYGSVYGRLYPDRPAPTITTGFLTPGRGRYIHPILRRTLTPHEAARIQGYPDTYDFFPDPRNPAKKTKLTKWIGDAVPMPLGYVAGISALGADFGRL